MPARGVMRWLGLGALALPLVGIPWAGAGTELQGFTASAAAHAVRATLETENFLIITSVIDTGGPIAQATLNAVEGKSFASLPYPGETTMSVPGLLAFAGGPSLPPYPFYVSASQLTPEQRISDPSDSYVLEATLRNRRAFGNARLVAGDAKGAASGGQAIASVAVVDGAVVATADSRVEGISVADGQLRIGTVLSRSSTRYAPGVEPVSTSGLELSGGQAGGLTFGYGPEGLKVAAAGTPLPVAQGLAALNEALSPAGVHIGFVDPGVVRGGVSANVFEVVYGVDLPTGGRGITRLRFGGTTTAVIAGESSFLSPVPDAEVPVTGAPVAPLQPADSMTAEAGAEPRVTDLVAAPERPAQPRGAPQRATSGAFSPPAGAVSEWTAPMALTPPPGTSLLTSPAYAPREIRPVTIAYAITVAVAVAIAAVSSIWRTRGGLSL